MKKLLSVLKRLSPFVFLFGVLLSCSTLKDYTPDQWLGTLPEGNYFQINAPRQLLRWSAQGGFSLGEISFLLDRTDTIYGSFTTTGGEISSYTVVLTGHYPYFRLNSALSFLSQWKRVKSTYIIFKNKEDNSYFSCPNDFILIISSGDPTDYIAGYRSVIPIVLRTEARTAREKNFFLYFPRIDDQMIPPSIPFNTKRLPLRESWIGMEEQEAEYTFQGGFHLENPEDARLFFKTFKTFVLALMGEMEVHGVAGRLRKSHFNQAENFIFFDGLEFSGQEIRKGVELFRGSPEKN